MLATGVPVAEIVPGEGVTLEDGTRIRARTVICNADPKVALPPARRRRPGRPTAAARRVGAAQPGREVQRRARPAPELDRRPRRDVPGARERRRHDRHGGRPARLRARPRGEPAVGFGEIYVQTGYDSSPAPAGKHLMSVFGQYAPYDLDHGDWDSRRDEVGPPVHRPDLPLRARLRGLPGALRGARAAGHRGADRPHRRPHLPGRRDARADVGAPADAAHGGPRLLPVRRRDAPGRAA